MNKWHEFYLEFWSWWRRTKLCRLYWKLLHRFHPRHQYNKLHTRLPPGYYDLDTQILYAVMNGFKEFYERGGSTLNRKADWDKFIEESLKEGNEFDADWHKNNYPIKKELDVIYDWWVERYLKIQKEHEEYWKNDNDGRSVKDMMKLEESLEDEANEMLARLMKYRRCLWD